MYEVILLAIDGSSADRPIIDHIKKLASAMHSKVVLLHVATGAPAQFYRDEAGGEEVDSSRNYLNEVKAELQAAGIESEIELRFGGPSKQIISWVNENPCDLVAMGTHGHKLLGDFFLGATATHVQHNISVPVLLLRAK